MLKRLLKIIISLLVTAAMFAIVHLVLQLNVFHFSSSNRFAAYLPAGLAILFGLIFYFIISSSVTDLLMKRLSQTEEKLSRMNVKELVFSVFGFQRLWSYGDIHCGSAEHFVRCTGVSCGEKEKR